VVVHTAAAVVIVHTAAAVVVVHTAAAGVVAHTVVAVVVDPLVHNRVGHTVVAAHSIASPEDHRVAVAGHIQQAYPSLGFPLF
jgi:hypothetical protein